LPPQRAQGIGCRITRRIRATTVDARSTVVVSFCDGLCEQTLLAARAALVVVIGPIDCIRHARLFIRLVHC
jgi:hypothetical protein